MNYAHEIDKHRKAERLWFKLVIAGLVVIAVIDLTTFILSQGNKSEIEACLDMGFILPRNQEQIDR